MEDFKIYIFVIQKSFLCSLGEISLDYNLHIEKLEARWAEPVSLNFHNVFRKLYIEPSIGASY